MGIISESLAGLEVGAPKVMRNLAVFPLSHSFGSPHPSYLTLDQALAEGSFHVGEVSEDGSVPELEAVNEGSRPVLLVDGEEVVGAKQNRIVNLSILVAAKSRLVIPVSCVERGRWAWRRRDFAASRHSFHAAGRAMKMAQVTDNLADHCGRFSNQGAMWEEINRKSRRMARNPSPTEAIDDLFVDHDVLLGEFVEALAPVDGHSGAVFALNGQVAGLELFDSPSTFSRVAPKLLRSWALDAIDDTAASSDVPGPEQVESLCDGLTAAAATVYPALGLGEDLRVSVDGLDAAALVASGRVVHLSAFASQGRGPGGRGGRQGGGDAPSMGGYGRPGMGPLSGRTDVPRTAR